MVQRKIVCFLAGTAVLFSLAGFIRIKIRWNSEEMQGSFPAESYPSEFYSVSEQAEECLPKAAVNTVVKSDGTGFYIRAVYEEDADFQEEMPALISAFQEEYGEFFAYGSRGSAPEDYKNRYSGRMVWLREDSAIVLTLDRNEEARAGLTVEFISDGIASVTGTVAEKKDHHFKISFENLDGEEEAWWIFMDYEDYLLYPDPFADLETGDSVQIWYRDEITSFGTAYEDEVSCHAMAVKKA